MVLVSILCASYKVYATIMALGRLESMGLSI